MSRHPELLIPASSLEVLKTAVIFGADAVYIGGEVFGLRAKAKNFSHDDMKEGIAFAHEHGVRVHVTVNILAHNRDLEGVREYLKELKELGPDALIIADRQFLRWQRRSALRLSDMSVHRRIIRTMALISSGGSREQSVWYLPENCRWQRSKRSVPISQKRWRLKALFMEQCAFPIPEDAC